MTIDKFRETKESEIISGMYPRVISTKEEIKHSENLCKSGIWRRKSIDGMIWYIWNNKDY